MHLRDGDLVKLRNFDQINDLDLERLMSMLDDETLAVLADILSNPSTQSTSIGIVMKIRKTEKAVTQSIPNSRARASTEIRVVTLVEVVWPVGVSPNIPFEFLEKIV